MHPFYQHLAEIFEVPSEAVERAVAKQRPYLPEGEVEIFNVQGQLVRFYMREFLYRLRYELDMAARDLFDERKETFSKARTISFEEASSLEVIDISDMKIGSFDISKNQNLTKFICGNNKFAILDISANPNLEVLDCVSIDYSYTPRENDRTEVKVNQIVFPKKDSKLISLHARGNELTSLDVSMLKQLRVLGCTHNSLANVVLPATETLEDIDLAGNPIKNIDVSKYPNLRELSLSSEFIKNIDLSSNVQITSLFIRCLNLTKLDITSLSKLETLFLDAGPAIKSIDLTKNTRLSFLDISSSVITEVDISKNLSLAHLYVRGEQIKVKFAPQQALYIQQLRKEVKLESEVKKLLALDDKAREYNWDDGIKGLLAIIANPRCDKATALNLYWLGQPLEFKKIVAGKNSSELDKEEKDLLKLFNTIETKIKNDEFTPNILPFNPEDYRGERLMSLEAKLSDLIPDYMKQSVSGNLSVVD